MQFRFKALLTLSLLGTANLAMAQQFSPLTVLEDLTPEQTQQIHALSAIPNKETTSPVFDFKLSKILTPSQASQYNALKDSKSTDQRPESYTFNIDSK